MSIRLTTSHRLIITFAAFILAVTGFMLKLPASFRHIDKELHAAFYFLAAAFLNILLAKRNLVYHIIIFIMLYVFGLAIEYSQAWSNKFFATRIHGRFDPEDVQWNLKGLIAFSLVWLAYTAVATIYIKTNRDNKKPAASTTNTKQAGALLTAINKITAFGLQPHVTVANRDLYLEQCLVEIYHCYLDTGDHFDDKDYPDFDPGMLAGIRQHAASNFKHFGFYKPIPDINDFTNLQDVATGDAIDDLADIIQDLLEVKWRIEHNSIDNGLWYFKFIFKTHTRQHVLDLLNYLNQKPE